MSESQQAAAETIELERYKQLQADYTKKAQQLAELERMQQAGDLVQRDQYDQQWREYVAQMAREKPDEFRLKFGVDAAADGRRNGASSSFPGYDEAIFVDGSEAQQRFVAEYGHRGLEKARIEHLAPEILSAAGVDRRFEEHQKELEEQRRLVAELQEQVQKAREYTDDTWMAVRESKDPLLKFMREQAELAKKDVPAWWGQLQREREELARLRELAAGSGSSAGTGARQGTSPADQAARINDAQSTPASAGTTAGGPGSQLGDPLDAILQKHYDLAVARP